MTVYLENATYDGGYRFRVRFNTDEEGVADLHDVLTNAPGKFGATFRNDPEAVRHFYLDPWPTLAWECGYDIAPERLYDLFQEQNSRRVAESSGEYANPS